MNFKACPKDVIENFTYDTQSIGETLGAGAKSRGAREILGGRGPKQGGAAAPPAPPAASPPSVRSIDEKPTIVPLGISH